MNDIQVLRDAGPQAQPLQDDVRSSARAMLLNEISKPPALRKWQLLSPSASLMARPRSSQTRALAIAVAGIAALVVALVMWNPGSAKAPRVQTANAGVVLAAFQMPSFPVSLTPTPEGLNGPNFDGSPDTTGMFYNSADPTSADQIAIGVTAEDPSTSTAQNGRPSRTNLTPVVVNGQPGVFAVFDDGADYAFAELSWELIPGQWVALDGFGAFSDPQRLAAVAATVVSRPQEVPLQLGLAPAGWTLQAFKDNGRIVTLVSDTDPAQTLSINLVDHLIPADLFPTGVMAAAGPSREVNINGLQAQIVPTDTGWFLQAAFADGTPFSVQAPQTFTADQVVAVAEQATYKP